jgi:hypothetical protein
MSRWDINTKVDLEVLGHETCEANSSGSESGPVSGSCEH